MSQFFVVPYSLIPGSRDHHSTKTIHRISAEHCAQLCVYDADIVCRSFDYHVSIVVVVVVSVVVVHSCVSMMPTWTAGLSTTMLVL